MRIRPTLAALAILPVIVVAGCGSSDTAADDAADSGTTQESATGTSDDPDGTGVDNAPGNDSAADGDTGEATDQPAAQEPPDTAVADPVDPAEMPTATGGFGDKPTITAPAVTPPDNLQRQILIEGDGPVSGPGSWMSVDYLGQVWGGDVFDNSYDRGAPFHVQVGSPAPQVVAGWDVGLQGVAAGSRVLLSFPPRDGYGPTGNEAAGISGTDTLIFVVDVHTVIAADAAGDPDAQPQDIPAGWPPVEGELGAAPTVTVPPTLPEPTFADKAVVAVGHGDPVEAGTVLVQYVATSWDGSHQEGSWPGAADAAGFGPQSFPVSESSPFQALLGVPVGSRVLLRTPDDPNTGIPPVAWVIDIVAQLDVAADQG